MYSKDIRLILKDLNLIPSKRLGQNFLINNTTSNFILNQAKIVKNDVILEIGPGLGALTENLVEKAKKVYAIEIDLKLVTYLKKIFSNINNLEIIHDNILNIDIPDHNKVVSNLPYTITGPILEKVFFKENPPEGILTIEKNIADRIFFQDDYKRLSRITISVNSFMNPLKRFKIPRNSFYPTPNIDLNLIVLSPKERINNFLIEGKTRSFYLKFIGGIMPYKNKNLVNALELYIKKKLNLNLNKNDIINILLEQNIENNKVYSYKIAQFLEISKIFYKRLKLNDNVTYN
jgi:16S rRNA (adenine1518-N6/adenine1519-N6)-dimethyltransferase